MMILGAIHVRVGGSVIVQIQSPPSRHYSTLLLELDCSFCALFPLKSDRGAAITYIIRHPFTTCCHGASLVYWNFYWYFPILASIALIRSTD